VFERFDEEARLAVERAFAEAEAFRHDQVGTEHLLLGLLSVGSGHAAEALVSCGATLEGCRAKVVEAAASKRRPSPGRELTLTDRAARALERATRLSLRQRDEYVNNDHILLSVLDVEGTAGQVLRGLFVDLTRLRAAVNNSHGPGVSGGRVAERAVPSHPRLGGGGPRCPKCEADLSSTLAHKAVASRGDNGLMVRWLFAYCSSCETALGGYRLAE
jgi:ATP-dependent Clp protease ATP-binding subunit ClpA